MAHGDVKLVRRCLQGDPGAWQDLVAAHRPALEAAIRQAWAGHGFRIDPARVEDLIQDTFLSLMKGDFAALRAYDGHRPLRRYLCAVAAHRSIDFLRGRTGEEARAAAGRERLLADLAHADDSSASGRAEAFEAGERLAALLERLPTRERLALRLFYWHGIPTEGIGRILGLGGRSVATVLFRARRKLGAFLCGNP